MPTDRQAADGTGETCDAFTTTDTLFVTVFHNLLRVSDGEEIDYYAPFDRERLQTDLLRTTEHYFAIFSDSYEYEDDFGCADYGIPDDRLADTELDTFRSVLDSNERNCLLSDLHPRSIFQGYRAVVDRRIRSNDLSIIQKGIELLNFVTECALPTLDERNPRCCITLRTAKEFAPAFIDNLLQAVRAHEENRFGFPRQSYLGEAFQPLQPVLTMLAKVVSNEAWPQNDLASLKLLLLVDHYRGLMRDPYGEANV